ncbi:glutathione S-transferase C-terminal-like protein [Cristinia sonorae]|uniref:Glutathione S-transferase C-terminal-like protein n=1 Tax=Cristinia sonorae TaxID=1940300 RepID=A0A8K0UEP7_9AGAR|nr:glutathione S-transferase C-terminal-like protein [Cristinia sonorae]
MSEGENFTLFSTKPSPSGWKVAVILEELGLKYKTTYLDLSTGEQKHPDYTRLNPNGQVPALVDHRNGDFVIWWGPFVAGFCLCRVDLLILIRDSGAIFAYLIEKYDVEGKISLKTLEEKTEMTQWMHFQSSGQGPMFSQLFYFGWRLQERVPVAIKRYQDEFVRIYTVLEGVLMNRERQGQQWLVGGKITAADLAFVVWNHFAPFLASGLEGGSFSLKSEFPHVAAWHKQMTERPAVKHVLDELAALNADLAMLNEGWR